MFYERVEVSSATNFLESNQPLDSDKFMQAISHQAIQILPMLDMWILSSQRPTFLLKGQDTLTIGDQVRWKWAEYVQAYSPQSTDTESRQRNLVRPTPPTVLPKVYYRSAKEVRAFLSAHPGLDKFMETAWPALTKYFGEGVEVILEVIDYPYANAQSELVGWIQVSGSIQAGLEKLDQFVDGWFLDHMAEVNHRFNFNVEIR